MQESSATRRLIDLRSVGPATIADFTTLGISTVEDLAVCDATELYARLCAVTGARHDPCCEDVFAAAIAQARSEALVESRAASADLEARLIAAEHQIDAARAQAVGALRDIAAETAATIVDRLTGVATDPALLSSAVDRAIAGATAHA